MLFAAVDADFIFADNTLYAESRIAPDASQQIRIKPPALFSADNRVMFAIASAQEYFANAAAARKMPDKKLLHAPFFQCKRIGESAAAPRGFPVSTSCARYRQASRGYRHQQRNLPHALRQPPMANRGQKTASKAVSFHLLP